MKLKFEIEISDTFLEKAFLSEQIINKSEIFENLTSTMLLDFKTEILKSLINRCHEERLKFEEANELLTQTNNEVKDFIGIEEYSEIEHKINLAISRYKYLFNIVDLEKQNFQLNNPNVFNVPDHVIKQHTKLTENQFREYEQLKAIFSRIRQSI